MMLKSDLALLDDELFFMIVSEYAWDDIQWHKDFSLAWTKLQENGCLNLRDNLTIGLSSPSNASNLPPSPSPEQKE
jgi:catalase (peroxidase I)